MKRTLFRSCALMFCLCAVLCGGEPRIAGFNYLIVIDPAVDEGGRPVAVINGDQVDVPPTLHVHPYFYSGDVEFQAQILEGGPTIIVASHPKAGEKCYINAILPPGAPVVAYCDESITYIYQNERVVIEFLRSKSNKTAVKYLSGQGIGSSIGEAVEKAKAKSAERKQQSKLHSEIKELTRDAGRMIKGSIGAASAAGAFTIERVRLIGGMIPGVKPLQSLADQAEERGATEAVRQAGLEQAREATQFIPTVR